ncbi:FAD binding domain-containing protein [Microdochium trichocladiopsis]|uniref:FAD binding domain-containing protein n=1 Tax=Microdochium trichocladiopsis TaxID=1682393 RepID=A0A9P8Y1C3_9PEZI|nr:FAD binding domain-containing protein [Microdochium trichocladiopsis]KAH7025769.1 FAD binding domain-containing protein [Microdochium trichocladiopsis]
MLAKLNQLLPAVALLATTVVSQQSTCDLVQAQTKISIWNRFSIDYTREQTEYWSTASGALKPKCILTPQNADEVAAIVSILRENNETFAIKSGGHNPNNYFASVDGGPLISTKKLNEVVFDRATETVRIGPGNRWDEVSGALDGSGYTVVGGRIGNVGVGGYLLGGGLSFMSTEYGWAANQVLEYTVVLANSTIVKITPDNHPNIYTALTTGGNNYGIVTSYLVKAYPQGDVWGGSLVFTATPNITVNLLSALRDFTENYPDEKAGIIMTAERTLGTLVDLWIMFLYYNGPEPPAGLFDRFINAGASINTCKTQSMHSLLSGNNWAVVKGSVYTIGTETIALPPAGPSGTEGDAVMQSVYDLWVEVSNKVKLVPGLIASIAFQPMPKMLTRVAKTHAGGDMLDLDDSIDRMIVELDYSFLFNSDYPKVDAIMRETYTGIRNVADNATAAGLMPQGYLPLFQNDCFYPQDYYGRLRPEKKALAQKVRAELDPQGLWRDRTGGFKIDL